MPTDLLSVLTPEDLKDLREAGRLSMENPGKMIPLPAAWQKLKDAMYDEMYPEMMRIRQEERGWLVR